MSSIVKNILIIILILVILVLGQESYFTKIEKNIWNWVSGWLQNIWGWVTEFWNKYILNKVSSGIEKSQAIIKEKINTQAEKATESLWQKARNFIIRSLGGSLEQSR